jgi:hypothetical protein
MNRLPFFSLGLIFCLVATRANCQENVISYNIVGYVNAPLFGGDNLIGNPLSNAPNTLDVVFGSVPDGSTFSPWDAGMRRFLPASTYTTGAGWDTNYTFLPGAGALFHATSLFTNTYIGEVLTGPGTNDINPPIPPVLGDGLYLLSSLFPMEIRTFEDIIGRSPKEGEAVTRLDVATQTYFTTTFHLGAWDNGVPTLAIAQAAFFNLGPIPEPTALSLAVLGCATFCFFRRKG